MFITVKAFNKKAYIDFYNLYKTSNKKSTDIVFDHIKNKDFEITFYKNGTILIKGDLNKELLNNLDLLIDKNIYIGSDEVGTGENVGPIVVCATQFRDIKNKKNLILKSIKDSKKMSFKDIEFLAQEIKKECKVECQILEPIKFNEIYPKIKNIKSVITLMHNGVHNAFKDDLIHVIDQYATKQFYEKYLLDLKIKVPDLKKYEFVTEGENKYLEIAAAAIVAKDIFNKWIIEYCDKNNIEYELKDKLNTNKIWENIKNKKVIIKNENEFIKKWKF